MSQVDDTRRIPLTQGYSVLVDASDFEYLSQFHWCLQRGWKDGRYAIRVEQVAPYKSKHIPMHRDLLEVNDPKIHVDHMNGDGLDNRRCNIRIADRSQNQANSRDRGNVNGYRGVKKNRNRFAASIRYGGKDYYLGNFKTPEEAARAWDVAALKYHGEFARLNFPE